MLVPDASTDRYLQWFRSGQSTNETLQLADDAATAGADFGLLLPPSYWAKALNNDAIVEFYRDVASHMKIPLIIYNVTITLVPFKMLSLVN